MRAGGDNSDVRPTALRADRQARGEDSGVQGEPRQGARERRPASAGVERAVAGPGRRDHAAVRAFARNGKGAKRVEGSKDRAAAEAEAEGLYRRQQLPAHLAAADAGQGAGVAGSGANSVPGGGVRAAAEDALRRAQAAGDDACAVVPLRGRVQGVAREEDAVAGVVRRQGGVQQRGHRAGDQAAAAATDPRNDRAVGARLLHGATGVHPRQRHDDGSAEASAGRSPPGISACSDPVSVLQRRPRAERTTTRQLDGVRRRLLGVGHGTVGRGEHADTSRRSGADAGEVGAHERGPVRGGQDELHPAHTIQGSGPRQLDAAAIQGTGHRAYGQGQALRRNVGQGVEVQGAPRRQSRQGDQGGAGAAQDEGIATQGGQAAGAECGAAGGGLRVAGVVSDRDARHEAAPAAVAEDRGASSHTRIPHRRAVGGRGGSRSASHGAETAEADDRVLGVDPQAGPVASALDAQAATTVHEAPVAAHESGGDVCRRLDRYSKRSQAVRVPAVGSAAGSGDL